MSGATVSSVIGAGYTDKKYYGNKPQIHIYLGRFQVIVPAVDSKDERMIIVAECLYKADAEAILKNYSKDKNV